MAKWDRETVAPQRNWIFYDFFGDLGSAGQTDHRWRDHSAGVREADEDNAMGSDDGIGPDGYGV